MFSNFTKYFGYTFLRFPPNVKYLHELSILIISQLLATHFILIYAKLELTQKLIRAVHECTHDRILIFYFNFYFRNFTIMTSISANSSKTGRIQGISKHFSSTFLVHNFKKNITLQFSTITLPNMTS